MYTYKTARLIGYVFIAYSLSLETINASEIKTLTPDDCRPAINSTSISNKIKNLSDALQCIEQKHRHIWWGLETEITSDNEAKLTSLKLKKLICNKVQTLENKATQSDQKDASGHYTYTVESKEQKINSDSDAIIYTQDKENVALRFQKYCLEGELLKYMLSIYISLKIYPKIIADSGNDYAFGKFLNYPEDDIIFYYKYTAHKLHNTSSTDPKAILVWADKHIDLWMPLLNRDKIKYTTWTTLNENVTNEELIKQNAALNEVIKNCIPLPKKEIVTPSTIQKTSWLKRVLISSGLLAIATALYKYSHPSKPSQ